MWVEIFFQICHWIVTVVILFVRMWVEIRLDSIEDKSLSSSSSWGCELKCNQGNRYFVPFCVILFVRMWVEILVFLSGVFGTFRHPLREDVSWNSVSFLHPFWPYRHPLREDVSWNTGAPWIASGISVILFVRMWVEISTSFWYCSTVSSSSSWGCELKYRSSLDCFRNFCHPLREDVSWNERYARKYGINYASSSSWGCELKYVKK